LIFMDLKFVLLCSRELTIASSPDPDKFSRNSHNSYFIYIHYYP
jgi:hypothetical protein